MRNTAINRVFTIFLENDKKSIVFQPKDTLRPVAEKFCQSKGTSLDMFDAVDVSGQVVPYDTELQHIDQLKITLISKLLLQYL